MLDSMDARIWGCLTLKILDIEDTTVDSEDARPSINFAAMLLFLQTCYVFVKLVTCS